MIDLAVAQFLQRFLIAVARQERAQIIALGMVRTHVHVLVRLHPTTNVPRLVQRLKGGSGVIANREGHAAVRDLKWAKGYDFESVSRQSIPAVAAYIASQAKHHPREAIPGWPPAENEIEESRQGVASRDS